jgi:hypothetical protein
MVKAAVKPTIVVATGAAGLGGKGLSKLSQEAVHDAIVAAHTEGVTNPKEINKRMIEAARKVRSGTLR